MLAILPRGGHQRNTARQRFENSYRRHTWKRRSVRPPRYVNGHPVAGENLRNFKVWRPTAVLDSRFGQRLLRLLRIANAVNAGFEAQVFCGFNQKFLQLGGTLIIAPVSDPHQIAIFFRIHRPKQRCVGSLMPDPYATAPSILSIHVRDRLSEREHAVITREIVLRHGGGVCCGAMMSVVKEKRVTARANMAP